MALNLDSPDIKSQGLIELFVFSKGELITNNRRMDIVFNVRTLLRCQGNESLESGLEGVFLRLFNYYIGSGLVPEMTSGKLDVPQAGKFIKGLAVGLIAPLLSRFNYGTVTFAIEKQEYSMELSVVLEAPPDLEWPARTYCSMKAFAPIVPAE